MPFTEKDVSRDPIAAQEMVRLSGQRGVPVIVIDGQPVVGFNAPRIRQLLAARPRPGLGLRVKDTPEGVLVGGVRPGSRAEAAGLRAGDLIQQIGGTPATSAALERLAEAPSVQLQVRRDGQRLTVVL